MKPPSTGKSKSFFDYSTREKKRIVGAATRESNRAQRELMEKATPSTEKWEKLAIITDKHWSQFNKNRNCSDWLLYRELCKYIDSLLSRQRQEIRNGLTKIFEKYSIEPMTGRVVMLELDVYFDTFSNKKHEED